MNTKTVAAITIVAASLYLNAAAEPSTPPSTESPIQTVRAVLATPENEVDLARAKLLLDHAVFPSTDIEGSLLQISAITATIENMVGRDATPVQKLAAVRRYLYVAGPWNQTHPYRYDLADPLGTKIPEKLLANYLKTRIGNCVSMPILFVILSDRLGLHVTASTAPFHVLARYVDDAKGKVFNIEATSGGLPARDEWYRQALPMSDLAVRNGVYLKTLSKRETVAVMAQVVLEQLLAEKRFHEIVEVSDVILGAYPHDVRALLAKGSAFAALIGVEFRSKYPTPAAIPPDLRATYTMYVQANRAAFDRAESLGWSESEGNPQKDARGPR